MKKNKLYTINKRRAEIINSPAFMPDENLYSIGSWLKGAGNKLSGVMGGGQLAGSPVGGLIGGIGSAVGGMANNLISGDYKSGAGSAISGIGSTVGSVISNVNPVLGGIVSVGSGIIGGAVNALFGQSVDEEALKQANEGTAAYNNFTSNAGTFDEIKGPEAQANVRDVYEDGLFGGDADEKNEALRQQRRDARQWADRSVGNNIFNLQQDQVNNAMRNFKAFGGLTRPKKRRFDDGGYMTQEEATKVVNNSWEANTLFNNAVPWTMKQDTIFGKEGFNAMYGNLLNGNSPALYSNGGQLESEFLDSFSSDPIGAAVRYNKGLERLAAEREAAQAAEEEANQIAAQQALINPDVQNQGMQFAMESAVPVLDTFAPLSSPSVATDDYSRLKSSLKKSEGFSRKATTLSGEAHPTIGYGFYNVYPGTTRKVKAGDTITEEEADKYLDTAIRERADELSRKVPNWDKLNSGQKDALIDLAFNAGSNAPHFRKNSKLMKALASEDWETAAANLATTSKNPAFRKGMQNRSNKRRNMFMGDYGLKAFGGELGTNGTDFTNGLLYIDEGGSHEENPFDGVPMGLDPEGIPNLVEEGETVYNNYVFSDRLKVPFFMYKELGLGGVMKKKGKEMSFADASKKLAQESEQRPNDPISQSGLQASLSKLAEIQETERMRKQAKEYTGLQEYSCGGGMKKKYPDGGYLWDDFWKTTNPTSKKKGNSSDKYQVDTTYKGNVSDREAESDYKAFTDYMLNDASDEERLKYFRWIDDNTGRERTYTDANGNLLDGWQQKYKDARTDGLWGIQHYTPKKANTALSSSIAFDQDLANAAVMADMGREATPVITDDVRQRIALDGYTPDATEKAIASAGERAAAEGDIEGEDTPKTYDTWMRYAPAVGAGIMTLTDALGLTNKPDYTYADALAAAARRAGYAPKISYNPIGNYLTYRPLDIWYEQNRANALSRATDRNIMNTSGGNRGTAMAGLIANGYNSQLASGNLYRQAVESNLEQRKQVEDFNRRTNMFNSQMGLEADMANARYHQAAQQMGLSGLAQAAALRDSIDSRIGAARSANITNFLNSLGNIGRENFALNQLNWDKSRNYSTDASGRSSYKRKRKAK